MQGDSGANGLSVHLIDLAIPIRSSDHWGLILAQPHVMPHLAFMGERYRWKNNDARRHQIDNLVHVAGLADDPRRAQHGHERTDVVVLPEYSVPWPEGYEALLKKIRTLSVTNQLWVGGLEGLGISEYEELVKSSDLPEEAKTSIISSTRLGRWVNSAFVLEKEGDRVKAYFQPKMRPCPEEQGLNMARGRDVLVFRSAGSNPVWIWLLTCFDLIGDRGTLIESLGRAFQSRLDGGVGTGETMVLIVVQNNPKPSHSDFLKAASHYVSGDTPWDAVHHRNSVLVMANTGGKTPGEFGETSIVFDPGARFVFYPHSRYRPQPTYSLRRRDGLYPCNEVRLRERRACAHALCLVPPTSTRGRAGDERWPVRGSAVHSLWPSSTNDGDPRFPDPPGCVCGYQKRLGDFLDVVMKSDEVTKGIDEYLAPYGAQEALLRHVNCYRTKDADQIKHIMKLLCQWWSRDGQGSRDKEDCDTWPDQETEICEALSKLVLVLMVFARAADELEDSDHGHGVYRVNRLRKTFVVMWSGTAHLDHRKIAEIVLKDVPSDPECPGGVVVIVPDDHLIVRGNGLKYTRRGSFLDPSADCQDSRITDARPCIRYFGDLMQALADSADVDELRGGTGILHGGEARP